MESMKRKLRKELRELKKGRINKEDYVIKRKNYKEWCKTQKKHEEAEEEKIKNIKSEKEAWKYRNKYRKKKSEGPSKNIQIDN